jgi:Ca2+/Na+ antiporter
MMPSPALVTIDKPSPASLPSQQPNRQNIQSESYPSRPVRNVGLGISERRSGLDSAQNLSCTDDMDSVIMSQYSDDDLDESEVESVRGGPDRQSHIDPGNMPLDSVDKGGVSSYQTRLIHQDSQNDLDGGHSGGHDHPNWGTVKSALVLLSATVFFSMIAEVLIASVDHVIDSKPSSGSTEGGKWVIDEKFLGLTLFALVPTVTEFYNAIAFARMGNIALSLEIGSAYT